MARPRKQLRDQIDGWLEEIRDELPEDLDFEVEGAVDRIQSIAHRIRRMLDETLEQQGLSGTDWKVLSQLRWGGPRSAGELAKRVELSSGAMTSRLDDLESEGLVRRRRDPNDRRGVIVELTDKGRRRHHEAIGVQAQKEALLGEALTATELAQLNNLLRRVMIELQERYPKS